MLADEKLDGFVFGRLVRSTLGASNGGRDTLELSELIRSTGLAPPRVHTACRRLAARGFVLVHRSEVRVTKLGRSAIQARFQETS